MELTFKALLFAFVGIFILAFYFLRRNLNYWRERGIPADEPHFIYGSLRGFRKNRILQDIYTGIYKTFKGTGPFCGMYLFMRPVALVLDPTTAKQILIKNFSTFPNRAVFHNERDDPLTAHLFALDGMKWKKLRQTLTPAFTSGKMKFMFPTIVSVAEQFVNVIQKMVMKGEIIEIKDLCARFTTDVISTCAFGVQCNSLTDANAEFRLMGRAAFTKPRHGPIVQGFLYSFPSLARKLRMREIHEDVHEFFMRVVRETVDFREKNNVKRNDFMDLLIELKSTKSLTIEQVAAQAFVFFLAGFETSSTTMGFVLYELARHQDIQDRARQEINDILAKHENKFTYEYLKDLLYLNQIIYETLRLYSVAPHIQRECVSDFVVPGHPKYRIEKGTLVIIPSSSFHYDPEFYPDPETFKPERFSHEEVLRRNSTEWLPFGDGPRNCIARRFGEMQARIGLALLLKNLKFSVCDRTSIPIEFDPMSIVLCAKNGIELSVERVD